MANEAAKKALLQARAKSLAGKTKNRLLAFAMDAEEAVEKGEDETGELAAAVEAIKNAVPLLDALEDIKSVGESEELGLDEEEDPEKKEKNGSATDSMLSPGDKREAGKGADAEDPEKKEGKGMDAAEVKRIVDAAVKGALATAMDAKDVVRTIADRDALVKKIAPHLSGIEQVAVTMDAADVAAYAVEKLSIPARKGHEVDALEGWLHGRTPAHKQTMAHTMDGKDRPTKGKSFLADQINARK